MKEEVTNMQLQKRNWILLVLRRVPLDRIHLMKALFLIWCRSGRKIKDYFEFERYLYGPCSFEVYSELDKLMADELIVQPPHPLPQWVNYYLTKKGNKEAGEIAKKVDIETMTLIEETAMEVSQLGFLELLKKVYTEAPDYAVNSMFRRVIR